MTSDLETILSNAEGEVSRRVFTGEQRGLFSRSYLTGKSVYERLEENESIHYLLVNRNKGVVVTSKQQSESRTVVPDRNLWTIAAVTNRRVFFVIGKKGEDGDIQLDLHENTIEEAKLRGGILTPKLEIKTATEAYEFSVRRRGSSDPSSVAAYIRKNLASTWSYPEINPEPRNQTAPTTDGGEATNTSTVDFSTLEETQDSPESNFIHDWSLVTESTVETLETAIRVVAETDTSEDNLGVVIAAFQSARDDFQQVTDKPGISNEQVQEAIGRLDAKLELLLRIRTAFGMAKRKLALAKNGMKTTEAALEELYETIDDGTEAATKLERSSTRLREYRERIAAEAEVIVSPRKDRRTNPSASSLQNPSRQPSVSEGTDGGKEESGSQVDRADASSDVGDKSHPYQVTGVDSEPSAGPSRNELLADLEMVGDLVEGRPQLGHVQKYSNHREQAFIDVFGSLETALDAAYPNENRTIERDATGRPDAGEENDSQPTRTEVIDEIERVGEQLGKRPTTTEFDTHAAYSISDIYDHFDSWGNAIDTADIKGASRQKLLDELRELESDLGFVPLSTHVNEHSQFTSYDYQQEFGAVDSAREKAGLDLEAHVMETLSEVVSNTDGKPKMADFSDTSPYSAGVIYKFFDSWDDAIAAVEPTVSEEQPTGAANPVQNELSERYELSRNLLTLVAAVVDAGNEWDEEEPLDPIIEWVARIDHHCHGSLIDVEGYGAQQRDRNSFTMREYRQAHGNGKHVTDFGIVPACRPTPSVSTLLAPYLDADPSKLYLPIDSKTNTPFPIIVESWDELERATEMLYRLPPKPSTAMDRETDAESDEKTGEDEGYDEGEGQWQWAKDDPNREASETPLEDVNGVTEAVAHLLQTAGYHSIEELKTASIEELAAIDEVSNQLAMRIKLDVGD